MSRNGTEPLSLAAEDDESAGATRVGELLGGKYELLRKVGEGAMGEVYEARHVQLGRRFAVKLLHPELLSSRRMLRRFSREVLAVSRLENDHLVPALDCGYAADGGPYYVMEFLRGADLRQVLRAEAPLATQRAVRLVIDLCRGLTVAHRGGLVHRDLKPENVFVVRCDNGGEAAKVLDFGLVQLASGSSTTHVGALVGTIRYMAPEQARGDQRVDQRADVYAAGAILYECLTGRPPHPGSSAEEVLFNRMNHAPRALAEQRLGLPEELEAVVLRALSSAPEARYSSALEFASALVPFAGVTVAGLDTSYPLRSADVEPADGSGITCDLELPGQSPKPARFKRRHWLGIAAACAVSGALVGYGGARQFEGESKQVTFAPGATAAVSTLGVAPASAEASPRAGDVASMPSAAPSLESERAPRSPPLASAGRVRGVPRRALLPAKPVAGEGGPAAPSSFFDLDNPYTKTGNAP